ncbi:uncharacterized protein Z518_03958 [Rhinocladiella mackenziei CBS 650.93]|uniref:RNA helicase n=1 Tax=Rhinocladiella mackenziei CBS 650.93 TaxID=1442369 RepID=A0A0D2IJW3_9EURO|nr:uncharacterized protein Z518_03958 [Rhinocladiella mackenziei CBS 650.93]KIX05984.1 hypothetical protein Z518_03958 [Rhinocladiella mackenziei CBS 650.93]
MPPKGKKRSATDAFTSKSTSPGESMNQHWTNVLPKLSTGKTVNFESRQGTSEKGFNAVTSTNSQPIKRGRNLKERARDLLPGRQQLPIYSHADQIRQKLRDHDVLLLVGETGSGKSTQIPQFLVNEQWCKKKKIGGGMTVGGCVAVTQPRRVAAISLARRVAEEMGSPLGNSSPASLVGYSVRFENSTSPSTRIKFLTEGMLLQEMLRDPWLKEYSAIVVDEVHERGVNVDLVLGFLRRMQNLSDKKDGRGGIGIKVVAMSATADMEKIRDFFNVSLDTSFVRQQEISHPPEAEEDRSGLSENEHPSDEKASRPKSPSQSTNVVPKAFSNRRNSSTATSLFIRGRQYPVMINYTPTPVPDILDAAYQRITHIHAHSPLPGDILVFLTGQETVESLLSLVTSWSNSIQKDPNQSKTLPKLLILPLYAALPSSMQQRVFQPTPKFTRKIILATNIAETSITVPGIRYVVDTGKAKQRLFRPSLNLDTLLTVPISRSSANQRSGRAGRDAPGTAYRLYTEADFYRLSQDTEPEILRCDLSQLVLTLKAHGIDELHSFPFLTPPPRKALERALTHLIQLTALDTSTGQITRLGREMSVLPLPVSLARVLLASAESEYNCIEEIIDIVSALSVENIFLNIHHQNQNQAHSNDPPTASTNLLESEGDEEVETRESRAQQARRALFRREGDHLTLLATVQAYAAENTDRRRWCEERFISHRGMSGAMDVRKQLTGLMSRYRNQKEDQGQAPFHGTNKMKDHLKNKDGDKSQTKDDDSSSAPKPAEEPRLASVPPSSVKPDEPLTTRILKCLLTGFYPNVARLSSDGSYRTLLTNQAVAIHPSSVLFSVSSTSTSAGSSSTGSNGTRRFEGIMYNEFVYTGTKAYARGRLVSNDLVNPSFGLLLLAGGAITTHDARITIHNVNGGVKVDIDGYISAILQGQDQDPQADAENTAHPI